MPCSLRLLGYATGQQVQHRHADCDAVGNLIENYRMRAVRYIAIDLYASVHGARVKNDEIAGRALHALARNTKNAIVFAQTGDEAGLHALELQTQHVDDIRPLDGLFNARED